MSWTDCAEEDKEHKFCSSSNAARIHRVTDNVAAKESVSAYISPDT